jgi:arylsulfatase
MLQSNALVRRDYKYIYWPSFDYEEVFNLTEDPYELTNQAQNATYHKMIQDMRVRYSKLQERAK